MRLFTGLAIPYEVRRNLELLLQHLKPAADVRWSPLDNLHITTKFIGEWPEERIGEMKRALAGVPVEGAIEISIAGLGWFPNPHSPRIFWAGVQAPESLGALAKRTERAAAALGVAVEERTFSPHLTLARMDPARTSRQEISALQRAVGELPSADFGRFTAGRFHLYRSQMKSGGSVYSVLESYSLTPGA
ncbi:MAG TPA: RNA 2',3'-cyclic phosphodiesterase [Solibacterales bacterium]|nr:RNA 2',3'-cyclic phosphodiesterase [Bryobacterales bacterium]